MAVTPVPTMTDVPPFPSLADRAAGTYNSKAYAFGTHMSDTFNAELEAVADNVLANATDAAASAVAAGTQATNAANSAATASTAATTATNRRDEAGAFRNEAETFKNAAEAAAAAASGAAAFTDTNAIVKGSADATKQVRMEVDGLTTGTTRVLTIQDKNLTVAGLDDVAPKVDKAGDTMTGPLIMSDQQTSRAMLKDCGYVFVDKGNSGTAAQTLDYTAGHMQKLTATGNHTIATSNWPPTGNLGEMVLELVNGGAFTLTWPTINWIRPDGTTTTSIATYLAANTGRTSLKSAGADFIFLFTRDGGATIYGKLI